MVRAAAACSMVLALVTLAPAGARADGVGNELTVGATEPTADNPRTGYVSNRLWGSADLRHVVTVRAEGSITRDAAAGADGWSFDDRGGNVLRLATSVDIYLSSHVALGLDANYSPETATSTATAVTFTAAGGATMPGYAEVQSAASTYGARADVEYDSAGESGFEWVADAAVGVQRYATQQQITALTDERGAPIGRDWLLASDCDRCGSELAAAMSGMRQSVYQLRTGATLLATIHTDTDVGVGGEYAAYSADPTAVGYFSLAAFGRDQVLGDGLHQAPVRFTARPAVTQRIGRVQLGSWFEYARYVGDEGDGLALGLRVQVRIGAFRVWCAGVGQADRNGPDDSPRSASVSVGARVRF